MSDIPPKRPRGRPPKNDTTSARAIQIKQDKLEAWRLRSELGMTYREIAKRLNIDVRVAYTYINENINRIENSTNKYREAYTQAQLDDLDRAINLMWQQASALPAIQPNDPKYSASEKSQVARARADVIRTINGLLERQAKLLGLDAPTQIEDVTDQTAPFIVMGFDPTQPPPADDE